MIFVILRGPKSSTALEVRLPLNQTSTGKVTTAVVASIHNCNRASQNLRKSGTSERIEFCSYRAMVATRLRELETWQLADAVRRAFIPLLRKDVVRRDFDFIDQTRSATHSACRNTAEGFYRFRHPEFANFVNIAIGSLGELVDGTD